MPTNAGALTFPENPLAVLQALTQELAPTPEPSPHTEDPMQACDARKKVATTVTSIRVPTDLWERLGRVAQITGRNKQDIIAEALRQYFETVRRDMTKGR